jgi:glycosyltransferase involved in cell wall biosynthesis
MKICMVLEGSYPYVTGGVSSWMHQYIRAFPQHEFVLWVIGAHAADRGKFRYQLPENVTEVQEVFLDDALALRSDGRKIPPLSQEEAREVRQLLNCGKPDWNRIFEMYHTRQINPLGFLMSNEFLEVLRKLCRDEYPYMPFADLFHTLRSMLLPVLYLIGSPVPQADVYHAVCTGYGGLLGALGAWKYKRPFLVTEHGIYTREREEELIRARWVQPTFKPYWIRFFYMLSDLAYRHADGVSCLFETARQIQISMGCEGKKTRVIANGVHEEKFRDIPQKTPDGWVDIGAVVRLAPIKDIKTMLYAFQELKSQYPNVRLHVMGGTDDEEYADECYALISRLKIRDVLFTGVVSVIEYLPKIDFILLTSISEGQPLSILEGFAAGRPCVTTDVGCCRALVFGEKGDALGQAGYCVPAMNKQALADAMGRLCAMEPAERQAMGEIGRQRVERYYRHETMVGNYEKMYKEVTAAWQASGLN